MYFRELHKLKHKYKYIEMYLRELQKVKYKYKYTETNTTINSQSFYNATAPLLVRVEKVWSCIM